MAASSSILFVSPTKLAFSSTSPTSPTSSRFSQTSQLFFGDVSSRRTAILFIRGGPSPLVECYKRGEDLDPSQEEEKNQSCFDSFESDEADVIFTGGMLESRKSGGKLLDIDTGDDLSGNTKKKNDRKGFWYHFVGGHRREYIERMRGLYPNGDPPGLSSKEDPVFTADSQRISFEMGQKMKEVISKFIELPNAVATDMYMFLWGLGLQGIVEVGLNVVSKNPVLSTLLPKPPGMIEEETESETVTKLRGMIEETESETVTVIEEDTKVTTVVTRVRRRVFTAEDQF